MGVYNKGMEMPKDCIVCPFGWNGCNKQHDFVYMGSRPDFCQLIDVHEPHGRLGDLDELYNHLNEWYLTHEHGFSETEKIYIRAMLSGVKDSPTIIEAEVET